MDKWTQWEQVSGRGLYWEEADKAMGRDEKREALLWRRAAPFDVWVDDSHHQSSYFKGNEAASNGTLGNWREGGRHHLSRGGETGPCEKHENLNAPHKPLDVDWSGYSSDVRAFPQNVHERAAN